jgi:hypothetical protein
MNGFDLIEAREILRAEGQNTLHTMDMHGGNKPCILHLDSGDAVVHQQPAPFLMYRWVVGEQSEAGFNGDCVPIRFDWGKPVSIRLAGLVKAF